MIYIAHVISQDEAEERLLNGEKIYGVLHGGYVDEIAKIDLSSDELYSSFMNMFAKWIGKTDEIYYSDKITVIEQDVNFDIPKGKYRIESIGSDWIFQGVVDIASDEQLYQYVRKYNLNIG